VHQGAGSAFNMTCFFYDGAASGIEHHLLISYVGPHCGAGSLLVVYWGAHGDHSRHRVPGRVLKIATILSLSALFLGVLVIAIVRFVPH
jgi:hypothetical protein